MSRAALGAQRLRAEGEHAHRKELGAGLIRLPDLPATQPERAVLLDAKVPGRKRICAKCDAALRREQGFCGKCGTKYSFVPTLHAGELVAGQYEVKGPIAFGGLGWIYLAYDQLLSRYVVLKGLLNAQDTSAANVAVNERKFLASVKHSNIVGIYNFVEAGGEGFIVMEYICGKTLKQIRQERGPLPPAEAIAYVHRILPAFAYLHRHGLVFCDFKPENVMLEHDDVKLIDLGGVRRMDDQGGDIYGTVGYSAPEAGAGPTPASDLFTVGRTLAVLVANITDFAGEHAHSLPTREEVPIFAQNESLYRFLLKATAELADDRFESAEAMAEQLLGVLQEVVALQSGVSRPVVSAHFTTHGGESLTPSLLDPIAADPKHLPMPTLKGNDAAEQSIASALAEPDPARLLWALHQISVAHPASREAKLHLAKAQVDVGNPLEAERLLRSMHEDDLWDWRTLWLLGYLHLVRREPGEARKLFDQVYYDLPGELAPKLGLALAAELAGDFEESASFYELVSRVNPSLEIALFGLARSLRRLNHSQAAMAALQRIPPSGALYSRAQIELHRIQLSTGTSEARLQDLCTAPALLNRLRPADRDRLQLEASLAQAHEAQVSPTPLQFLRQMGFAPADRKATSSAPSLLERVLRALTQWFGRPRSLTYVARHQGQRRRSLS